MNEPTAARTQEAGPRWQRRPDARRDEIIAAAAGRFARQGFSRTTLGEVASAAGVSKGTIYHYFDTKEALFDAVVLANFGAALDAGEELLVRHRGSYRELLQSLLRRLWTTMSSEELLRLTLLVEFERDQFPDSARCYYDDLAVPARRLFRSVIDAGVAAGEFRHLDREMAVRAIPHMIFGVVRARYSHSPYDSEAPPDERMIEGILDLLFLGIDRRGPGGGE